MKEQVSRLMDSALDSAEQTRVLDAMAEQAELRRSWQRYHLIGAAMRNELGGAVDPALAERIAAQIRKERAATGKRVLPFRARALPRQVASLALAASVAAIAVFTLVPRHQESTPEDQTAALAQLPAERVARSGTTRWDTLSPEMENTLNAYLVEHGEFAGSPGLNGLTSYARFVSYDANQ
jgi:sigma-E factor negative regulatory protein RseA